MSEPEAFGLRLAEHFLERNPQLRRVDASTWSIISGGGSTIGEREHGQAFMRRGPDTRAATVMADRDRPWSSKPASTIC